MWLFMGVGRAGVAKPLQLVPIILIADRSRLLGEKRQEDLSLSVKRCGLDSPLMNCGQYDTLTIVGQTASGIACRCYPVSFIELQPNQP